MANEATEETGSEAAGQTPGKGYALACVSERGGCHFWRSGFADPTVLSGTQLCFGMGGWKQ